MAAFALGVVLLSLRERYTGHLEDYFFGSLLAVTRVECAWLGVLALAVVGWIVAHWRWLGRWVFDEDLARAANSSHSRGHGWPAGHGARLGSVAVCRDRWLRRSSSPPTPQETEVRPPRLDLRASTSVDQKSPRD